MANQKILVVDDDNFVIDIVVKSLKAPGREFVTAMDGVEAVERVFREMPDLVILDVMMPRMNGYQVCRFLKNDKNTWRIPVLMLTAKDRAPDRQYGKSSGADEYLVKPFKPARLREVVDSLLEKYEAVSVSASVRPPATVNETNLLSSVNALLDSKLQEMTFLQDMTRAMMSTFDEAAILNTVLKGLSSDLGYSRSVIFLQDGTGDLTARVQTGYPEHKEKLVFNLRDDESLARLLHRKEPVVHRGKLEEVIGGWPETDQADLARQQCLVPIVSRDEVRGVILIDRQEGEPPFSREKMGVLFTLAAQLGMAMENAALYKATVDLSNTDGLTGLFNARYFYTKLEGEIIRARRYSHDLTLFMMDIDLFKAYNDKYGHLSGDDALKHIAGIIKENSRETDIVTRYGGEEFAVVLPETGLQKARVLAERLRKAVEASSIDPGGGQPPVNLTISIGIAVLADSEEKAEEFVKCADKALYRAKQEGRNRVCTLC